MIVRQSWIWPGVLWLVWSGIVTSHIEHEQQRLVPDPNEVELAEKTFVGGHESRETYQGSAHQDAEESREPFLWEEKIRAKSQSLAQELKPHDLKVVVENVHDQVRIDVHASRHNPEFSREDSATTLHRTANIQFSLRHIAHHGSHRYPWLHVRLDLNHEPFRPPRYALSTQLQPIQRLRDRSVPAMQRVYDGARRGDNMALDADAWTVDTVQGPNITDKPTVLTLARMANDAYVKEPGTGDWRDVDSGSEYNHSQSFGWESDGLRGHIFATPNNDTVVVAIKGTSPAVFDGAETTTSDKINDNLFFACCCGQGGQYLWHQVCDCMTSAFTCNQTCLVTALREENRYYKASIELYGNVTALYPQSNIWLVGHSLGGATSALLGLTFGLPVVTFEAPGEALAAARLGLPTPPGMVPNAPQTRKLTGAYHFGHTADPIFMGSCNAATSACTLGGYAMQTVCHTGQVCRYDTVQDKGWRVGAGYHKIKNVIPDVIEVYDQPAACVPDDGCIDCFNWKYFESNSSSSITTSISSTTSTTSATRTATCQTPGWWGCLDEATSATTSTTSASLPSTSCVKYGWFGGCVETTTISPTTWSSVPATASATTTRSNQDL